MSDPTHPPPDAGPVVEPDSNPPDAAADVRVDVYDVSVSVSDANPPLPSVIPPVREFVDRLAALQLPRRPNAGARGVLLADTEVGLIALLDADDANRTFRVRAVRILDGDPADIPHTITPAHDGIVRAAYENQYDVIAAPWAGDTTDPESPAAAPRRRGRGGK